MWCNTFSREYRDGIFTNPGDPIHKLYNAFVGDDGAIKLKQVGTENTDEIIHSYRESTELTTILAKFANGDTSALNKYQGFYGDITQVPKCHREALDAVLNAEAAFSALPVDIRQQFSNDWRKWLSDAGSASWLQIMDPLITKPSTAEKPVEPPSEPSER